jgi:hypothetical protein
VAIAFEPVTANILVSGLTCLVSQVACRQPRPKLHPSAVHCASQAECSAGVKQTRLNGK